MNITNILLDVGVPHYYLYKLPSEKRKINLSNHDHLPVSTIEFNIPPFHDCTIVINYTDSIQSYFEYGTKQEERKIKLELKMVSVISKVRNILFEYYHTGLKDHSTHKLNWDVTFMVA